MPEHSQHLSDAEAGRLNVEETKKQKNSRQDPTWLGLESQWL